MNSTIDFLAEDGFEFVKIEPGDFYMGQLENDPYAKENEMRHHVKLTSPFYMLTTPVTVKQYLQYVKKSNIDTSYLIEKWDGEDWVMGPYFNDINVEEDYPVVGVSYYDAIAFIEWMQKEYQINFRLPTEAEFEYAARSNCTCANECKYAMLAKERHLDRREEEYPRKKSFPIGDMIQNTFGLKGMHCSIWQWCSDWYFYYLEDEINPSGPSSEPNYAPWKGEKWKSGKVIRGGSFSYPYYHSRCSDRHYSVTTDRNYNVGFRIVFDCRGDLDD